MPKLNLTKMDVGSLIGLQTQVNETLVRRRGELEKQLEELDGIGGTERNGRRMRRGSKLKGRKIAPKYRLGKQTWAGRGARPRWLVAAMKESGKKLKDFLIDKSHKR
jgi:DNA-binding protein H-NS